MATNKPRPGVSAVWDIVTLDPEDERYVICNTCQRRISRGLSLTRANFTNTNITGHLKRCNPIGLEKALQAKLIRHRHRHSLSSSN